MGAAKRRRPHEFDHKLLHELRRTLVAVLVSGPAPSIRCLGVAALVGIQLQLRRNRALSLLA